MSRKRPLELDEVRQQGLAAASWDLEPELDTEEVKRKPLASKNGERFNFSSGTDIGSLQTKKQPKTTSYSTNWAIRNFEQWKRARNEQFPSDPVPENLLKEGNLSEIDKWLSFYITETRNCKGEAYPPKSLYQLLTGLLRHSRSVNENAPNFLDKSNVSFRAFHAVLDNIFKKLRQEGIGSESKHAEIITKDEECKLWDEHVLNLCTPKGLLRSVFYCNGKNFCLRGGMEHRNLQLSQFTRFSDHYLYTENASKNRQGGFVQLKVENKRVPIYANSDAGERCHVHILDTYISKLPDEVKQQDYFYTRPLSKMPLDPDEPWFCAVPVGKNILSSMMKDICTETHISGHKTNHSLRATGASELFEAGVPEKIIKERTGHLSLESLRMYERTTSHQHKAVSTILSSDKKTTFKEAVQQQQQQTYCQPSPAVPFQPAPVYNNCTFNMYSTVPVSTSTPQ